MGDEFASKSDLREHTVHIEGEIGLVRETLRKEMSRLEDRLLSRIDAIENRLIVRLGGMMAAGIRLLAVLLALLK